ncbi:MAG: endonuclease/exonuclease/phosphatase family protein [Pseudonocardiales bacterium]
MRIVTFNVLHGRSLSDGRVDGGRARQQFAALGADVLGLQEVDWAQPRSGRIDLPALAAEAAGSGASYRYAPALIGTPGRTWRAAGNADEQRPEQPSYGIALVTRLPVRSWHVVRLRMAPMRSVIVKPDSRSRLMLVADEPRVMLAAVVDGPAGPMTVATTHLSFVPGWNIWQLRRVCRALRRLPAPRILLGDLNLPGRIPGAVSGWRMLARTPTYPNPEPHVQLDHVLGNGALPQVLRASASAMELSDHCALTVDLGAP